MIKLNRCSELNLPLPKPCQDQRAYVLALVMGGYRIDTRTARYIGIGNLHSVLSALRKQYKITVEHRTAYCPDEKVTPPQPVDWAYMTPEQRVLNRERMIKGGEA